MGCLLGIDVGTGGTKTAVIDANRGRAMLGIGAAAYPLHTPQPAWAEQDPDDWWQATIAAVRQALERSGVAGREIAGVGLSGQMQGSVFLDAADRVLRRALLWCDQRTGAVAEQISQAIGQPRIVELTCNPVRMGSTASKILWLREHEPEIYNRVRRLLLPKDYVRLRLTGEHATDVTDASATALFDVAARAWSAEMAQALAVPREWLPPVYDSAAVAGRISARTAAATGLAAGTPVVAGSGDVTGLEHATVNVQESALYVTECAAFGAALFAGVGVGCYGDIAEACRATVRVETISAPSAEHRAVYERNYLPHRNQFLAAPT